MSGSTDPVVIAGTGLDSAGTDRVAAAATPAAYRWPVWFLIAAVIALGFNLRPAVSSLGAVLGDVRTALDLSPMEGGLLTTLPVLCFAGFGATAAGAARRFGSHHVLAAALVAMVAGSVLRATTSVTVLFLAATVLALAGMAMGNVILPAFVKAHFPGRIGPATAAYTTAMAVGTTVPAAVTVPIAQAAGGWRFGLGVWAVTAAVALVPWLLLAGTDHPRRERLAARAGRAVDTPVERRLTMRDLGRSRIAWALAIYFGLQSTQAYAAFGWLAQIYRDAGLDATDAGLLMSALPFCGIPVSLVLPGIAARMRDQRMLVLACGLCYVVGYAGLMVAPGTVSLVWALLLGLGGSAFPLTLTMIGLRSRSHEVTSRLSGFTQSVGYTVAAVGPLAVGALYGITGGWSVPIGLLLVLVAPQVVAGLVAAKARFVDDELRLPVTGPGS